MLLGEREACWLLVAAATFHQCDLRHLNHGLFRRKVFSVLAIVEQQATSPRSNSQRTSRSQSRFSEVKRKNRDIKNNDRLPASVGKILCVCHCYRAVSVTNCIGKKKMCVASSRNVETAQSQISAHRATLARAAKSLGLRFTSVLSLVALGATFDDNSGF